MQRWYLARWTAMHQAGDVSIQVRKSCLPCCHLTNKTEKGTNAQTSWSHRMQKQLQHCYLKLHHSTTYHAAKTIHIWSKLQMGRGICSYQYTSSLSVHLVGALYWSPFSADTFHNTANSTILSTSSFASCTYQHCLPHPGAVHPHLRLPPSSCITISAADLPTISVCRSTLIPNLTASSCNFPLVTLSMHGTTSPVSVTYSLELPPTEICW